MSSVVGDTSGKVEYCEETQAELWAEADRYIEAARYATNLAVRGRLAGKALELVRCAEALRGRPMP
jgi:hypothetical protein